jgi:RNA polymerase sigma-70 factor (ECF subfamily)
MAVEGPDLIREVAGGDGAAFARFYDRYAPVVYPLILRIVRQPAEAADVLQDVFWEVWQRAGDYDGSRGTVEAWLVTRARSRAIDRVRAARRRGETFVTSPAGDPAELPSEPAPDPGDRVAERRTVEGALGRLPDAQREVIELAYYDGLTQTEIAERLKQPLGTVKTRIRLGLERLREIVKGAG